MRIVPCLVVGLVLAGGCAGNVKTTMLAPQGLDVSKEVQGVVYFLPTYIRTTYTYTALVDPKGVLSATCSRVVQKEEVSMVADLDRPAVIHNASGPFSAAKLSVALDKGMLASVNVEPTQKVSDVLSGVAGLVKEVGAVSMAESGKSATACNAAPIVTEITRIKLK